MENRLQQVLNAIALPFSSLKKLIFKATAISGTVSNKLRKTDCVEDDCDCKKTSNIEIRNQNSWKPKLWWLTYPLDSFFYKKYKKYQELILLDTWNKWYDEGLDVLTIKFNNKKDYLNFQLNFWRERPDNFLNFDSSLYFVLKGYYNDLCCRRYIIENKIQFALTIFIKYFKYRII